MIKPRFTLELEAIPAPWMGPPARRLARLLKVLKRGYHFRCLDVRETTPVEPPKANESYEKAQTEPAR